MTKRNGFGAGFLICGVFAVLIFWFSNLYLRENARLTRLLETAAQLQTVTALLVKEMGYTGFIHNFKNYILRGDEQYYQAASANMERIDRFLFESRSHHDSPVFEQYYQELSDTLAQYKANLELARRLHHLGESPTAIDHQVKVDDSRAAIALRKIIDHYQDGQQQSMEQLQSYNRRVLLIQTGLIAAALLLGVFSTLLLLYYLSILRVRQSALSRLSAKQRLLGAVPNPMLLINKEDQILFANDGAAALFEATTDELTRVTLDRLFAVDFPFERFREHLFVGGGNTRLVNPVYMQTLKGKPLELELSLGRFQIEGEQYLVASFADCSQAAAYRDRLDAAERIFRTTFEIAPIGIVHLDLDGGFLQVNPRFANMLGRSGDELKGTTIDTVCVAEDGAAAGDFIARLVNQDLDFCREEKRLLHREGRPLWCNLIATLYRDKKGIPQYVIAVVEDVSQRHHFEQHLLNAEKKFRAIAQYVNGVVWMSTPGITRLLFVSEGYERIWKRSRESLYSNPRSFIDAVVSEDRQRVQDALKRHALGEWKIRYRIECPDGATRHIEDEGTPVRNEAGEILYLVGLARDVTEEQLFKERLEQTNQHLERLARFDPLTMAMRRQFAQAELDECIALHKRYKTDATLVFVDLDDFKQVNDLYGHETGDEVLMEFARIVRQIIRVTDGFYRYAGDEFLILLRETDKDEAAKVVEKMLRKLPMVQVGLGTVIRLSFSCGICSLGEHYCTSARDWVRQADEEMYLYKRRKKEAQPEQVQ